MTRLEFLLKAFATNTEQMRGMLDNQQTIVDTLVEKGKETKDNTYSDIVSDGGLDPRTKYAYISCMYFGILIAAI